MSRLEVIQQLPDPGAAPLREAATRSGTDEKACGRLTYGCIVLDDRSARLNRCPRPRRESLGLTGGRQLERQGRAGGKLARRRDVARGLARRRLAGAASLLGTSRLLRGRRRRSLLVVPVRVRIPVPLRVSGLFPAGGGGVLTSDVHPAGHPGAGLLVLLPEPAGLLPLCQGVPGRLAAGRAAAPSASSLRGSRGPETCPSAGPGC